MLIDLNMNPSRQDGFIVAQDRSFLKPRRSGKSGTSQIVSFEHAEASAALAASFKSASGRLGTISGLFVIKFRIVATPKLKLGRRHRPCRLGPSQLTISGFVATLGGTFQMGTSRDPFVIR
jgi:hypothetical protein